MRAAWQRSRLRRHRIGSASGEDALNWARGADYAWDFVRDRARFARKDVGALSNTPGWSFTRASTGYAQTQAGVLVPFASGALRRTDKGVLIEGAGTNLCLQSQTFDNASWTKNRSSISANAIAAPDGTTTADKLVEDNTATNNHRTFQSITTTAVETTFSVYAKAGERSWIYLRLDRSDHTTTPQVWFNLATGAVGTAQTGMTGRITALANGWYRCEATVDAALAGSNAAIIGLATADANTNYSGDGASGAYLWGAQLEATAYASSYIPTTTGSATRAADSLTVTGVTGLDYPLSLYAEAEVIVGNDGTMSQGLLAVSGAANNNAELMRSSTSALRTQIVATTTQMDTSAGAMSALGIYKAALRVATNDSRHCLNGALQTADTSVTLPSAPTAIDFGNRGGGSSFFYCYLPRAALFTRALTNAELQAITA